MIACFSAAPCIILLLLWSFKQLLSKKFTIKILYATSYMPSMFYLPTYLIDWLTSHCSPSWEANSHSVSQEIPHLLWYLMVHYHVHKSPPLFPILSQMHPLHTFTPYFPKIYSNITLPHHLQLGLWVVSSLQVFWTKVCMHFSYFPCVLHAQPVSSFLIWSP